MERGRRLTVINATSTMSAADPTRSQGIGLGSGTRARFPGLTVAEAERVGRDLDVEPESDIAATLERTLVRIDLPAVLSDGAGPHLLDADGHLTLALGVHPKIDGTRVVMGEPHPEHAVGLVTPISDEEPSFLWRWLGRRDVSPADRVRALDEIHDLASIEAVMAWASAGGGPRNR